MKNRFVRIFSLLFALLLLSTAFTTLVAAEAVELPAEETEAVEEGLLDITFDRLPENLARMGIGMAAIIVVMGVLILVTTVLNKATAPKDKE